MTKKDYVLLAAALRGATITDDCLERVTYAVADALKADNERFDDARFIAACIDGVAA